MSSSHPPTLYDDMQARIVAAYSAFEGVYRVQHPEPQRPPAARLSASDLLVIASIGVMVIAAMIVSGSRTIAEFGQVGGAAFLMLEVGALILAIWRAINASEDQRRFSRRLVKAGLLICVGVMLAANIDATARAHAVAIPAWAQTIILLAVAVSAPVLTFIAGDLLGIQAVAIGRRQAALDADYQAAAAAWRDAMLRSWDAQKSRWGGVVQVSAEPSAALSDQTDIRQTLPAPSGFARTPDGQRRVADYLDANPSDADLSARALAARIAERTGVTVGHDTANKGRNAWRVGTRNSASEITSEGDLS
ncbi:MAG: hypothetical protein L6Q98_17725 [Anaerolineae bacterium]|nr:hypothetical protein [Anaerolineae bacterium]NUQ05953.1 hypothetical protein [Anaerolineae bacterium]